MATQEATEGEEEKEEKGGGRKKKETDDVDDDIDDADNVNANDAGGDRGGDGRTHQRTAVHRGLLGSMSGRCQAMMRLRSSFNFVVITNKMRLVMLVVVASVRVAMVVMMVVAHGRARGSGFVSNDDAED